MLANGVRLDAGPWWGRTSIKLSATFSLGQLRWRVSIILASCLWEGGLWV